MAKVNIDALIPREDFETTGVNNAGNLKHSISVSDFTNSFFYPFIRKPDFQRETSEWDARKISDFLESYINGDLIPSIILWRSNSGLFFVIDGAHRFSALTSWIDDDYGDGEISQKFYEGNIPEDQKTIALEARKYINKKIGSYAEIIDAPRQPIPNPDYLNRAKNLGAFSIQVQWVDGDASKAEHSFFKINQQGEPLNKTELKLLQSRKKGNAIAARAIIRAGKGHKYWATFTADNQKKIQEISDEINKILFTPPLKTPVKSLELPIAGKISASQTLPLILDFINIVNQITPDFNSKLPDDTNGDDTLRYLTKVRKVAWRINSIHPSSLGLHPIVYFYSADGRYKTASFYAITAWVLEAEATNSLKDFTKVRLNFEKLLLKYDYLVQDINRKYRQAINSYMHIKDFYMGCIKNLLIGKNIDAAITEIIKTKEFNYLKIDTTKEDVTSADFTSGRKSAIFIKEALANGLKCKICNGLIHQNSLTFDHIIRKEDGGIGSVENGQISHPFCNSTIKN
ncbi:MAG: DUF262 domain-containing protein [Methylobacter sp.]|nr:DUF262 domain-containing protein [Methylobacter sp.]